MGIADRLPLYRRLETLRARPLIVYATSIRQQAAGQMASDAIPELLDQLTALEDGPHEIDLLVVSQGGDPTVAWRAMSLLRERFEHVAVLVPQAAYSAATLLALGADEIVMHPHGNLGPVDPQVSVKRKLPGSDQETELRFGYEELMSFLTFAKQEAGLSDQQHLATLFQTFCQEVGAVPVGIAARASLLSISMGEKLLRMHMTSESDVTKAKGIAEALNKKFFHHGYPVSRKEAKEIGLKIADSNADLERVMWKIWLDIEGELQTRKPFNPVVELFQDSASDPLLQPVPQIQLPSNLPAPLAQQLLQQAINQIQIQLDLVRPVDFRVVSAVMESVRVASRCLVEGKILACRMPDLQLRVNAITTRNGWIPETLPEPKDIDDQNMSISETTGSRIDKRHPRVARPQPTSRGRAKRSET